MDVEVRDEAIARAREAEERTEQDRDRGSPERTRLGRGVIALLVMLALLAIGAGVWWYLRAAGEVSTSDARIAGNVTQVAPQISGRVVAILFADNQHVEKGQKLIEIDPRDYAARLEQAEAQQASAQTQITQAKAELLVHQAALDQAKANVSVAQADLFQATKDYQRYNHINPAAVAQQQRDQADAAYRSATAKLVAMRQAVDGAAAQIEVAKTAIAAAEAGLKQSQAAVRQAEIQLSYTTITAPVAGYVTHRAVNVGDVVAPGQAMFALVHDAVWVDADFKETQLAGMKPGDPVTIAVDAVPGVKFHGVVNSFQYGTGSAFSVLPAENATGNWVKIVQRVPVKITFDGDADQHYFLAPGMSAEPTVTLRR